MRSRRLGHLAGGRDLVGRQARRTLGHRSCRGRRHGGSAATHPLARHLEGLHRQALQGSPVERRPHLRRERTTGHAGQTPGPLQRHHVPVLVGLGHHDRGRQLRGVAHVPGGHVVVRRAGLAGGRTSEAQRRRAGSDVDDLLEGEVDVVHHGLVELALGVDVQLVVGLLVGGLDLLDQLRVGTLTAGGECRICVGHVQCRGRCGSQDRGRISLQSSGVARYAGLDRGLAHVVGSDLQAQFHVRGVDGVLRGLEQGDSAVAHVPVVLQGVALDRARGTAVPRRVQADVLLERRGEGERLERRPCQRRGLGGVVELVAQVVLAAVHRNDLAGAGSDAGQADTQALGVVRRAVVADRGDGRILRLLVDGGGHPVAVEVDVVVGIAEVQQRQAGALQQVAVRALEVVVRTAPRDRLREHQRVRFGLSEGPGDHHAVHDIVPTRAQIGLSLLARVEGGRADDGREVSGLGGVELGGALAEVGPRRGLDAVGAAAVIDGVEIVGQNLVLARLGLQFDRQDQFLELTAERLLLRQVGVLRVLLGDRRGALDCAAGDVVPGCPGQAARVETAVAVVAAVLGREHRRLHLRGDPIQRNTRAVGLPDPADLGLAVVVVDPRRLRHGEVVGLGNLGGGHSDAEPDERDDYQGDERPEQQFPRGQPSAKAGAAGPRIVDPAPPLLLRRSLCCHVRILVPY